MLWESLRHFEKRKVKDSNEALRKLLSWGGFLDEFEEFKKREELYSFGIGKGVVLYKKQAERENAELSILVAKPCIEYDSFDGVLISIFCFLSSPGDKSSYFQSLSRFYRLMNSATFRERLVRSESEEEVRKLIKKEEKDLE
ncbi:MAG: PTS sugar transporter subunit IIA [candidate division WOR-3 bacterium]|nr:PTS sugar transporter subunit IIA [candidate division WOR-3 bacterium]